MFSGSTPTGEGKEVGMGRGKSWIVIKPQLNGTGPSELSRGAGPLNLFPSNCYEHRSSHRMWAHNQEAVF